MTERSKLCRRAGLASAPLVLLGASVAAADVPPLFLEHLTTADGLPQATVMTTLQDSQGFVWLGTEDGLVRFDGRELQRYAHSRTDAGSLAGNFIRQVVEDAHGDLWIAVKGAGLARWDRNTDRFTSYRHDPDDPASLASDNVRAVLVDPRGRIWVGMSDAGVDVLDPFSGGIEHLRHDPADPSSLGDDRASTLALDRAGNVWIGTDTGLNVWGADTRTVTRVGGEPGPASPLDDMEVSSVLETRTGTLWIGSFNAGLAHIDRDGRILETFDAGDDSFGSNDVRALLEDRSGRLWIGTADGLALRDPSTGAFVRYRHDAGDAVSLRDSFVMSLYQDTTGILWIGTRSGGVSRFNPSSWAFGGRRPEWLENQPVMAFADGPDGTVWVASLTGLVRFDPANGAAVPLDDLVGRPNALGDTRVMSLRRDRQGALWIGTMSDGLKRLSADGDVESIPVQPGDPRSLSAPGIMSIFESRAGAIWIGTFGGGANVLDPATRSVRQLPFDASVPGAVSAPNVTAIVEDERGNIWLGTDGGGLNLARADGTVLRVFRNEPGDARTLPSNTVYALAVDEDGRIWAATDAGLARIVNPDAEPAAIELEILTRDEGLSSDVLYGIVPDGMGHVWLSGNSGLMRLDPETGAVKTYHRQHGLQGEEFSFGAYSRLRDGRVCFGGPGGFNIFDPAKLDENTLPPRVVLTNVEVLGVRAAGETPFWLRDRISLDYRGSIVSLDFGVLDFTSPAHNRLAYRMAGLTKDWIDLGTQRRITLTNLDPGDHVLELRGANSDSVWNETPMALTIHRDPAPWASGWAYAAYAAALLAFVAERIRRHRRKFRELAGARARLEHEVQLRTRELTESNRQLEEAARAKSDFLDRMSHELRTPMNGVVGMTELLSRTPLSPTQSHLTTTIRSSAEILLQIVNDLLDLSKIRAGKVALERLPIDLGQVLEECASLFAGAAETKGIELVVCPPAPAERALLGDPLRLRQVLINLVGNAVKFTVQGEVVVKADVEASDAGRARVRVAVADTGVGIKAAAVDKIFAPFAQADETTTRRFGGTGLGLAICHELTELMGGEITVESQPQIGSTFCLSLPLDLGDAAARRGPAPLPPRRVSVLTRRPSLAECVVRHASSFGLDVLAGDPDAGAGVDVRVVDAGSLSKALRCALESPRPSEPALIVIASAAEVDGHGLRALVPDEQLVLKPVRQNALYEAFVSALALEPRAGAAAAARVPESLFAGHVLLVEDEPINAAVAEGYLAALGCTSVWVTSGADAVARAAAERFDLILMDLSMPGMDGFATADLIRRQQVRAADGDSARVPIVALTAHDATHYREKCLAAGLDDILSKPYTFEECSRLLARWLTGERAGAGAGADADRAARARGAPQAPEVPDIDAAATLTAVDPNAVETLRRLNGGAQPDLYSKLVELFRSSSTQSLTSLREALDRDDLTAAAAVAHKLASAAANVGGIAYANEVRRLERRAADLDGAGARESARRLHNAHSTLLEALENHCLRATA